MRKSVIGLVVMFLLATAVAHADELVLQPGPGDGKDTNIANYQYSDTNLGDYYYMEVFRFNYYAPPFEGRFLVQFDIPLDSKKANLNSATLSLYMQNSMNSQPFYADIITSNWDEKTVTWNTQPLYNTLSQSSSGPVVSSPSSWVSMDITQMCSYWLSNSQENYGASITASYNNWGAFYCSDYSDAMYRPKLTLNYSVAPEPASMILFGLGGTAMAFFRRRKAVKREVI